MSKYGILPIKLTEPIKQLQKLSTLLSSLYPAGDSKEILKFCQELEKQRNILDFSIIQKHITEDFRLAVEFEIVVLQYYSSLLILEFLLSRTLLNQNVDINIGFKWNNSFNPKSSLISIVDLNYEIISLLYNLAVIYYYQGIYFISIPSKSEKLKGIAKLRNFLRGVTEVESRINEIHTQIPADLDPSILSIFKSYVKGIIANVLNELMTESPNINTKMVIGLWLAASQSFEEAITNSRNLDSGFAELKLFKTLKNNIHYNMTLSKLKAFHIITQILNEKAKEDPVKGFMGNCVFYTDMMKKDLEIFTNKSEQALLLTKDQREHAIKEYKTILKILDERTRLNDRLYVDKEAELQSLSEYFEESKTEISCLEPTKLKTSLLESIKTIGFVNEKIEIMKEKLKDRILCYSNELDREIYKLEIIREGINKRYDVPGTVAGKYKNFKEPEIPMQLIEKIQIFNKRGGLDVILAQSATINNMRHSYTALLDEISQFLQDEQKEDNELSQKYGKDWDRPPSEKVNVPLMMRLNDLKSRIVVSKKNDELSLKRIEELRMWMMLFQSDFKEIMSKFFPKDLSRSQNIINKIAEKISELDHEIQLSYEDIRAKRIEFDKQDDQQILTDSLLKNRFYKSQSLLITELLTPHTNKFDLLYDLITHHMKLLNKMTVEVHNLVNQEERYNNKKIEEDWMKVLENIEIVRSNLKAAENFYGQLGMHCKELHNNVKSYCQSRNEEKIKQEGIIKYLDDLKNKKKKEPLFS